MKDWRITHANEVDKLVSKGWSIMAVGMSLDETVSKSKRRFWPVGAKWFWTSGTVIAPPAQAETQEKAA
jgi:hypothetical protein